MRIAHTSLAALFALAFIAAAPSRQDMAHVTGTIAVATTAKRSPDLSNVVVWLKPVRESDAVSPAPVRARILQKNKTFEPHMLVIPIGSVVEFPNRDPFFHNVFSLYDGKRFDLGLYEAGMSRDVTFTKPGVSFIFCNIHPEMSAVVVALDTPYHAISDRAGRVSIDVPLGRYQLFVWHERFAPADDAKYPREVSVSAGDVSLGVIQLAESDQVIAPHTNKYGRDYNPPHTTSPTYKKPGN